MDHYGIDKRYPEGALHPAAQSLLYLNRSHQCLFTVDCVGHPPDLMVAPSQSQERARCKIVDSYAPSNRESTLVSEGQEVIPGHSRPVFHRFPVLSRHPTQTVTNLHHPGGSFLQ